ncbi:MlaD family protein [Prochlorococcus sp. MIT 1223]|uniref:MlaD family protein n=1 Tax=Prochlorococcus sp. MIT 1223 TaxID=3096217 RepID=UPI002A756C5F|nr:MlaD family protein [Prochlorococcus sp. MIT 1223]
MRRSLRDACVGFSLIGGIVVFSGAMLWLRGVRFSSNSWSITATFKDASGLSEMSPVSYRGILVGSVKKIEFTPKSVEAKIEINNKNLILTKPVYAKVITNSVLGGDAQVSLISLGLPLAENKLPISKECNNNKIVCNGDKIEGRKLKSISALTEELQKIVLRAEEEDVLGDMLESMEQFDKTQENLDDLILLSKKELIRAKPIITELIEAASHLNNILATIDNPKTLNDLINTAGSARSLTNKIDKLSTNIEQITSDKELIAALRDVTIGLSKFFNDVYK